MPSQARTIRCNALRVPNALPIGAAVVSPAEQSNAASQPARPSGYQLIRWPSARPPFLPEEQAVVAEIFCGLPWWQMVKKAKTTGRWKIFSPILFAYVGGTHFIVGWAGDVTDRGHVRDSLPSWGRHLAATLHVPPRQVYREGWQDRGDSHSYSWTFSAAIFQ